MTPGAGAEINAADFPVQIKLLPEAIQPASMLAPLNGLPLRPSSGPRPYTTVVTADFPLREQNLLAVEVVYIGIRIEQRIRHAPPATLIGAEEPDQPVAGFGAFGEFSSALVAPLLSDRCTLGAAGRRPRLQARVPSFSDPRADVVGRYGL